MALEVAINAGGRMSLPADVRKRLGLDGAGKVYLEEIDGGVVLRTVPQIVTHAQAIARKYAAAPGATLAEFMAARAADSGE